MIVNTKRTCFSSRLALCIGKPTGLFILPFLAPGANLLLSQVGQSGDPGLKPAWNYKAKPISRLLDRQPIITITAFFAARVSL